MPTATDPMAPTSGIASAAELLVPDSDVDIVVAIDTLVDGVHFPTTTPAADVGFKALAVNLSDLAAMGADPQAARISLTLPGDDADAMHAWCADFEDGLGTLAARYGVSVAPPATTRGPLSVTVEALGSVPRGMALRRNGAAPGDRILVTGTLGDAGLALTDESASLAPQDRSRVQVRLTRPEPRVDAGIALRGLASAAIDVSDGLCADLGHLLTASASGALVALDNIPLSPTLADALPRDRALALALSSGDDYELCFTVAPGHLADAERRLQDLGCRVTQIGTVTADTGLQVLRADGTRFEPGPGYRHFP
jgi:thiamine-monophosphate kinase